MRLSLPVCGLVAILAFAGPLPAKADEPLWTELRGNGSDWRQSLPELNELRRARLVQLRKEAMTHKLEALQRESGLPPPMRRPVVISVPLPDGSSERFRLEKSPVLAPALAARYPDILTFKGVGVDSPTAWGRFEWTRPGGFHGYVQIRGETVYINPVDAGKGHYLSFYRRDLKRHAPRFYRENETDEIRLPRLEPELPSKLGGSPAAASTGNQLRTYRLAVAATGEYTGYHGGTKVSALSAITTAINRVSGIFEQEFSVALQLVANNDNVIYTDGGTDPYDNESINSTELGTNQTTLDAVIGSGAYDMGHLFTAPASGGGGLATTPSVCDNANKARGMSGVASPAGDPFWVDIVAHEMGHQLSASHSFNGVLGSCAGNRSAATAYEPGSGSTIMSYSGSCGADNVAIDSDAYFHTGSFEQIAAYVSGAAGATCGSVGATANTAPVADAGAGGFTIPMETPFELVGSAEDAEGDALTFGWEQIDLGDAGSPDMPVGNAPLFRSFPATASPRRAFPQWSDILNNAHSIGELLPDYTRGLNFRLSARDGSGGVGSADVSFQITDTAGPFLVTAPNAAGLNLTGGAGFEVTWNVANTDSAPVNCTQVDILLSPDGGSHFSAPLLAATANDGIQSVTIPDIVASNGRIKVQCSDNAFFDVSDNDFGVGTQPAGALVRDGGFEGGTPSAEWTESSILDASLNPSITNDPGQARSGSWFVWFGKFLGDHSSVSQTGPIPAGGATLEFYLTGFAVGNSPAELRVKVDGNTEWTVDNTQINDYSSGYQLITLDLSAYADGGSHTLLFEGQTNLGTSDGSNFTGFQVDDIRLLTAPHQYVLDVTRTGAGSGWVESTFGGIQCGSDCDETYMVGIVASLTASPDAGSTFVGWSGGGCSGNGSCAVTMTASQSVTAEFAASVSACHPGTHTLDTSYSSGMYEFSAEVGIDTSGTVVIGSGAEVTLRAPVISLQPGFQATAGSTFAAVAQTVNCGA